MAAPRSDDGLLEALTRAIDGLRAAGFEEDAKDLGGLVFETTWTISSEMIGEIGLAILRIQQQARGRLPADVAKDIESCMSHVKQVWPEIKLGKGPGARVRRR